MGPLESKTAWFCVKHKGIARLILMPITVIACVMSAYLFNLPTAVPVIIAVVLVLFIELFVSSAPMAVMKKALLFVSIYGKEIYAVQHARKLLDAIDKDSAKNEQAVEKQQ